MIKLHEKTYGLLLLSRPEFKEDNLYLNYNQSQNSKTLIHLVTNMLYAGEGEILA